MLIPHGAVKPDNKNAEGWLEEGGDCFMPQAYAVERALASGC